MKRNFVLTVVLCFVLGLSVSAQVRTPQASPSAKLEQTIGLTKVMVEYSRPSVKGRTIFGKENEESIEKYGKPWRTGANNPTKITFGDAVTINGETLEKGAYTVLSTPTPKSWTVKFYPLEKGGWMSYVDKEPVLEVSILPVTLDVPVETFLIDINNITSEAATLDFAWGTTLVSIPFKVQTDEKVMDAIAAAMAGPSAEDYYLAASYYHDTERDLNQALTWIKKSNEMDPKFWTVRKEALILADMKMYGKAIEAAKLSKEMAEKADYEPYIRMNEASIKEWTVKARVSPAAKKMIKKEKAATLKKAESSSSKSQ